MTIVRFLLTGMLLALLAPLSRADNPDQRILLSAGDSAVTRQDLQQDLLLLPEPERAKTLASPAQLKELLRQIYQGKRMIAEAERLGLDQTPQGRALLAAARRQAMSDALREYTRERIEPPDFTALAREHYVARRDDFQLPERFKAAHILKKVSCDCEREEKRRQIEQLRTRLQAGEDFATLARAESDDTGSAAKGGDLGDWMNRDKLVAPFAEALAKLNPGQVSEVVETRFGFHLIKLQDRQPARLQSFEEVQSSIEQGLRLTYTQEQLQKQAASYLPGADAKFDDDALQALARGQ